MVLQIWNSGTNSHRRWKRICKQAFGRIVRTAQCSTFQDNTMQCTQNGKKMLGFICWWDNTQLGWIFTSPNACIQYQLTFNHCYYSIWAPIWCQIMTSIFANPRHSASALWRIFSCREISIAATRMPSHSPTCWTTRYKVQSQQSQFCPTKILFSSKSFAVQQLWVKIQS